MVTSWSFRNSEQIVRSDSLSPLLLCIAQFFPPLNTMLNGSRNASRLNSGMQVTNCNCLNCVLRHQWHAVLDSRNRRLSFCKNASTSLCARCSCMRKFPYNICSCLQSFNEALFQTSNPRVFTIPDYVFSTPVKTSTVRTVSGRISRSFRSEETPVPVACCEIWILKLGCV